MNNIIGDAHFFRLKSDGILTGIGSSNFELYAEVISNALEKDIFGFKSEDRDTNGTYKIEKALKSVIKSHNLLEFDARNEENYIAALILLCYYHGYSLNGELSPWLYVDLELIDRILIEEYNVSNPIMQSEMSKGKILFDCQDKTGAYNKKGTKLIYISTEILQNIDECLKNCKDKISVNAYDVSWDNLNQKNATEKRVLLAKFATRMLAKFSEICLRNQSEMAFVIHNLNNNLEN